MSVEAVGRIVVALVVDPDKLRDHWDPVTRPAFVASLGNLLESGPQ